MSTATYLPNLRTINDLINRPRYLIYKVSHSTGRVFANTKPHQLHAQGWPGSGVSYVVHRIESDCWPYSKGR